ncbi:hypothetical protein K1719_043366 [Acacia pycnantha]|nr:hypothetical protein K1719_043366 [Acacia pycnantha]
MIITTKWKIRDSDRESNAAIILVASNAQNSEKISIYCVISSMNAIFLISHQREDGERFGLCERKARQSPL